MHDQQTAQPVLTESEWVLLTELLEEEERALGVEICHTDSRAYRNQLQQRNDVVGLLLARLRATLAAE